VAGLRKRSQQYKFLYRYRGGPRRSERWADPEESAYGLGNQWPMAWEIATMDGSKPQWPDDDAEECLYAVRRGPKVYQSLPKKLNIAGIFHTHTLRRVALVGGLR
jgi:hypothetical protein